MFTKLTIHNFKSHKHTIIDFHEGINAIIGSSDSGKTNILRSIYWVLYNRPLGNSILSDWILEKDIIKKNEACSVMIQKRGTPDLIKRERSRLVIEGKIHEFNGYIIGGRSPFEAIGQGEPPEEVKGFFQLTEVNIQRQMDRHFLLGNTPGEVARFLNNIVKLDVIDEALSIIDKKKRECSTNIKQLTKEKEELEKELEGYGWLSKVEELINNTESIENDITQKQKVLDGLTALLIGHNHSKETIDRLSKINKASDLLNDAQGLQTKIKIKDELITTMKASLFEYNQAVNNKNKVRKLLKKEETINRILKLLGKIEEKMEFLVEIKDSLKEYKHLMEKIPIITQNIKQMEADLPDICPICGSPMNKG